MIAVRPALVGFLALALAAAPVAAAPARKPAAPAPARDAVVVLPIAVRGVPDGHLGRSLEDRVADGLRRGGFAPVAADKVRARVPAAGCDAACLAAAVAGTGARWVVRAEVAAEGRDYGVQLVLLDPGTGEAVVTTAEQCEICGHEELGERVGDLASRLQRELTARVTPPPRLRIVTRPDGSAVRIDGAVVGVTPLDLAVTAGEHDIVIERPGYIAHRRKLLAAEGRTDTIADELAPVPPPPSAAPPPRRRLAPIGWAALGAGLAAAIGGAALVALDERPITRDCSGENVDIEGHCKYRHDTLAGGATLLSLGVAAVVAGVVVLALDRRRAAPPRRAALRPHATGLLVRF